MGYFYGNMYDIDFRTNQYTCKGMKSETRLVQNKKDGKIGKVSFWVYQIQEPTVGAWVS